MGQGVTEGSSSKYVGSGWAEKGASSFPLRVLRVHRTYFYSLVAKFGTRSES